MKGREPVLMRDPACAHTLCSHCISIWHRDCSPTSAAIVQNHRARTVSTVKRANSLDQDGRQRPYLGSMTTDDVEGHQSWPRGAVYLCREGRCQLEPDEDAFESLSQHGNVVRRGVVPSVTGLCFGVMAWPPPAKEPSRKSAVGRGGPD